MCNKKQKLNIIKVCGLFPNDDVAEKWFIQNRWQNGIQCPTCKSDKISNRINARGKKSFRCKSCRKDFTTKTGNSYGI